MRSHAWHAVLDKVQVVHEASRDGGLVVTEEPTSCLPPNKRVVWSSLCGTPQRATQVSACAVRFYLLASNSFRVLDYSPNDSCVALVAVRLRRKQLNPLLFACIQQLSCARLFPKRQLRGTGCGAVAKEAVESARSRGMAIFKQHSI